MVAATSTAAEEGSKTLGGLVVVAVPRWDPPNLLATDFASADIPPARCLAPVNGAPASAVVRRGLASMLVEVSQPKSHYFVSVTFPIR